MDNTLKARGVAIVGIRLKEEQETGEEDCWAAAIDLEVSKA